MLSDEQIKQKWTECVKSHRRGDVISSVDMAIELARWVEQQTAAHSALTQARIEGAQAGIEAAANVADSGYILPSLDKGRYGELVTVDTSEVAEAIRALDPQAVVDEQGVHSER